MGTVARIKRNLNIFTYTYNILHVEMFVKRDIYFVCVFNNCTYYFSSRGTLSFPYNIWVPTPEYVCLMRVSISNVMYTKNKNKSYKNCKYYDKVKHVTSCLFSATIAYG